MRAIGFGAVDDFAEFSFSFGDCPMGSCHGAYSDMVILVTVIEELESKDVGRNCIGPSLRSG